MICCLRVEAVRGTITHHGPFDPAGTWVESYNPDAFEGRGDVTLTGELARAQRFANTAEALAFYYTVSRVRPTRPDGKPNRPLTAFTISVVPVDPEELT